MALRTRAIADGLTALGVKPGERVAIIGDTQLEWMLMHLGVLGAGATTVAIYQSNKPHEVQYILENSGATWVAADSEAQVAKVQSIRAQMPQLKGLLRMQGAAKDSWERSLADLERLGGEYAKSNPRAHETRVAAIKADDLACLLYTSGTTGNPKGVMLTHSNWAYEAESVREIELLGVDDSVLFFLPLAHSFAQVIAAAWLHLGFVMAFAESIDKLVDNAGEVSPTVMPAVPRIFEKAYANVIQKGLATPGIKGRMFKMALGAFEEYAAAKDEKKDYSSLSFTIGKSVVFPKLAQTLKDRFGGRMRMFISGGAPLSPKIANFFDLLGILILEGYGLTETSAASFVNRPKKNKIGTVGPVFPGSQARIAEDGEILIKGGGVMKGYWNNPEATAEVLKDGWFATGDIGQLDAEGYLKITDRKKDIIVTAAGKNVAPQNLENELKTDNLVSQVMVHGDKRKFLSALITLNEDNAKKWASDNGLPSLPWAELIQHPKVVERIQRAVDGLNAKQASYSTIKKFAIIPKDFTIETGELTPTLKVKRKVCTQKYKDVLDGFYVEGGQGD
jgi:long-chain acyl-CoA synthetase